MISQTELQDEPENTPSLILKVDLRPLAVCIEEKFGDLLLPPPAGVYSFRQVEPVLVPGKKYYLCRDTTEAGPLIDRAIRTGGVRYTRQADKMLIEVPDWQTSWQTLNEALYSDNGNMVLSAGLMADKARLVSDTPILPYRGMRLAHLIYDQAIDSRIAWPHMHINHLHLIQEQLVPGAYPDDDELDIHLDPFYLMAQEYTFDFIERHHYHLFNSKLVGSTLTLTRFQDYRILAWHRDQREKAQAEQERKRCS